MPTKVSTEGRSGCSSRMLSAQALAAPHQGVARVPGANPGGLEQAQGVRHVAVAVGDVVDGGQRGRRIDRGAAAREELGRLHGRRGEGELGGRDGDRSAHEQGPGAPDLGVGDVHRRNEARRRRSEQLGGADAAVSRLDRLLPDPRHPWRRCRHGANCQAAN